MSPILRQAALQQHVVMNAESLPVAMLFRELGQQWSVRGSETPIVKVKSSSVLALKVSLPSVKAFQNVIAVCGSSMDQLRECTPDGAIRLLATRLV